MTRLTKFISILMFFIICGVAMAATSPVTTLQSVSAQVLAELKTNQKSLKSNPRLSYNIIKRQLLPHVDIEGMSRSVLGREVWSQATPTQRQEFVQAFTELMIRTYARAFSAYTNEDVKFHPIRGGAEGKSRTQVESEIIRTTGPTIAVNYRMVLLGGAWKVYDFSIENISMLQSFRAQFSEELHHGGLPALLQKLTQHNASRK
ncbi:ABC transporter substrate-binding protein [soil metagenome]